MSTLAAVTQLNADLDAFLTFLSGQATQGNINPSNGSTLGSASAVVAFGGNTVAALSLYSPGQQVTGVDSFQPLLNYLITPAGSPTGPTQLLMTATFY